MTEELERFHQVCRDLECGSLRVAEKVDGQWKVNSWVKEVILSGFRLGKLVTRIPFRQEVFPLRTGLG